MNKLAIYGGSFDPFHIGHQLIIPYVLSMTDVSKLYIVPCHTHPFGKQMAPFKDRIAMCQKATSIYGDKVFVSQVEEYLAEKMGKNFTIHTINYYLELWPKITLILGSDIIQDLPKWQSFDELNALIKADKLELFFVNRKGYTGAGERIQLPNVSSTTIRECIKDNKPVEEMLPQSVYHYIKENNLYGYK
jgi:nicotinate-nucleotide adenylyltransferase